jgi:4-azaleucine resistance transporter AzlC
LDSPRSALWAGIKAQVPGTLGIIPFGLITGAASNAAGIDPWFAFALSIIVYAGAAQLAAISLIAQHAPATVLLLTVTVINLRMLMYSAAVAPLFQHLNWRWKAAIGYTLTDNAFALMLAKFDRNNPHIHGHWFYAGAAGYLWVVWQLSVGLGIFGGSKLPDSWGMEFTIPLFFLSLLLPALRTRCHWTTAVVAGLASVVTVALPFKLGLLVAAFVGMATGLLCEYRVKNNE